MAPGAHLRARRHGSQPGRQARAKRAPRAAHANNPRAPRAPLTPQNAILHPVTPHLAPTRRALGQRRARMRPLSLQLERTQRFSSRFLNCAAPAPRARACCTHLIARGDTRGQLGVACSLGPRPAACAAAAGGRASAARRLFACSCMCCLLGILISSLERVWLTQPAGAAPPARSRGHGSAWRWPSPQKAYSGGDLTPEVGPESGAEGALSAPEEERTTPTPDGPICPFPRADESKRNIHVCARWRGAPRAPFLLGRSESDQGGARAGRPARPKLP